MSAVTAVTAVTNVLVERSWTSFFLGSGIAFFTLVAWVGTSASQAACTSAMWAAIFTGPWAAAPTSACIASAAVAGLAVAVAGGLTAYGTEQGWTWENVGAKVPSKRDVYGNITYPKLYDTNFGLIHNFDAENTKLLNLTYGGMLDKYNTTLAHVTWLETFPNGNYTNSPFNGLNMTFGRFVTLNDNGVIRTAVGPTEKLGDILEGFDLFKSNNGSVPQPEKRQGQEEIVVEWMSFNTYGENMNEAAGLQEGLVYDLVYSEQPADWGADGWAESFDYYSTKFCLAASPPGDGQGVDSIIVGEVYTNAYGGIDGQCDSG